MLHEPGVFSPADLLAAVTSQRRNGQYGASKLFREESSRLHGVTFNMEIAVIGPEGYQRERTDSLLNERFSFSRVCLRCIRAGQRDDFLDDLELPDAQDRVTDPVARHLQQVLEQGDAPTGERSNQPRSVA